MTEHFDIYLLLKAQQEGAAAYKEAESGLLGVAKAAAAVAAVVGGALIFGVVEAEKHMEETAHRAYEMSKQFGLGVEQAQQWIAAGAEAGISADQVSNAFKFLSRNMETLNLQAHASVVDQRAVMESTEALKIATQKYNQEVIHHGKNSLQAQSALLGLQRAQDHHNKTLGEAATKLNPIAADFQTLGVRIYDASGKLRDADDVMADIADAFAKMPDGVEKAGIALKLFGRSGIDVVPFLDQGSKKIFEFMKEAREMGVILSKDQVAAAEEAYKAHKRLDLAFQGLTNQVAIMAMPTLMRFSTWMTSTGIPAIKQLIVWLQANLGPAIQNMRNQFLEWWPTIQKVWFWFTEKLRPAILDIKKHGSDFIPIVQAIGLILIGVAIAIVGVVAAIIILIDWFIKAYTYIRKITDEGFTQLNDILVAHAGALKEVIDFVKELIGWWDKLSKAAKQVQMPGTQGARDWLSQHLSGDVTVAGPKRHSGGDVFSGQTYVVGGPGAEELFVPRTSGTIVPMRTPTSGASGGAQDFTQVVQILRMIEQHLAFMKTEAPAITATAMVRRGG